ncbi:hypothetical protein RRF57_007435 [Xylaria bambusicola]|uniref:Uncharacterized protein n=1 Tax=Xylaria bambusicola TaxID=326684 RepID=A0AAN7UTP3_9PEZI
MAMEKGQMKCRLAQGVFDLQRLAASSQLAHHHLIASQYSHVKCRLSVFGSYSSKPGVLSQFRYQSSVTFSNSEVQGRSATAILSQYVDISQE